MTVNQAIEMSRPLEEIEERILDLDSTRRDCEHQIAVLLLEAKTSDHFAEKPVDDFYAWAKAKFDFGKTRVQQFVGELKTTPVFESDTPEGEVDDDDSNVHFSSATNEWETPQDLFDQLNAEFGFELDVCATADNTKCPAYFDKSINGLEQPWDATCWMNPPYGGAIGKWMARAHEWGTKEKPVVCLVPARTDTNWWWNHARFGEIRFLRGRLKFGGAENSAPFPSSVVIFGRAASVQWWER